MLKYWRVAVVAFLAMMAQDCLTTVMVVFEAQKNGTMAGLFDVANYFAWLVCAGLAIGEVNKNGWRSPKARVIIGAVTAANFLGTILGVALAKVLS